MAEPIMRTEVKDPLQLSPNPSQVNQIQQGGAPRAPASDYQPANTAAKIQAGMGVLQGLIHDEIQTAHQDAVNKGKMDYMSGVTEADLAKNGDYYSKAGYHLLKTRDEANVWFQKEADYITNEGANVDPKGYLEELTNKRKAFLDQYTDPYSKEVAAAALEDFSPKLIENQYKANSGANHASELDQFGKTLLSGANTSGDTPRVVPGSTLAVSPTVVSRPFVSGMDDRDVGIRTILGEAAGEGDLGMAAVAWVMRNRVDAGAWGKTIKQVALADKQFSAWNSENSGGNNPSKWSTTSPAYLKAAAVYDAVMAGKTVDPTGGATHYYAPGGMAGGAKPDWWDEERRKAGGSVKIGNQIFAGKGASQLTFADGATSDSGPVYTIGDRPNGMVTDGTIDLSNRPQVKNEDGSISTVDSFSYTNKAGRVTLIPSVTDEGVHFKVKNPDGSWNHAEMDKAKQYWFDKGGKNLGTFDTPEQASAYAERLHKQQEDYYLKGGKEKQAGERATLAGAVEGAGGQGGSKLLSSSRVSFRGQTAAAAAMLRGIQDDGVVPELRINSGFRSVAGNKAAKGAKDSQHTHGNAVDISLIDPKTGKQYDEATKARILQSAIAHGARGIGIYSSGNVLHVDVRGGAPVVWGWGKDPHGGMDYRSAPAWAQPALAEVFGGKAPGQVVGTRNAPMAGDPGISGPSTSIQQVFAGYPRLKPDEKAEVLTNMMVKSLGVGDESLWTSVGGAGGVAKYVTSDQMFKIQAAREKFEKAEDAKFDLNREKEMAGWIDEVESGADVSKVLEKVAQSNRDGRLNDRMASSITQKLLATERRKGAEGSKLSSDPAYVQAVGTATRKYMMLKTDVTDPERMSGDQFVQGITDDLLKAHPGMVLSEADKAVIEAKRQELLTGTLSSDQAAAKQKQAQDDAATIAEQKALDAESKAEAKAKATAEAAKVKHEGENQLKTMVAQEIIYKWEKAFREANLSDDDKIEMDNKTLARGLTEELSKAGFQLGFDETNDLATKIRTLAEDADKRRENEIIARAKKVEDSRATKDAIDHAVQTGSPIDGINGSVSVDGKVDLTATEYAIESVKKLAISTVQSNPVFATKSQEEIKGAIEKMAYEKMAKMGLVDTQLSNSLNGIAAGGVMDPKTKEVTARAADNFATYFSTMMNGNIAESYKAKIMGTLSPEAQNLFETAKTYVEAGAMNLTEALGQSDTRSKEKVDINQSVTRSETYTAEMSKILSETVWSSQFRNAWYSIVPENARQDLVRAEANPENARVLRDATKVFADYAWLNSPWIPAKAAAEIAKAKVIERTDFMGDQFVVNHNPNGQTIRKDVGLESYGANAMNSAMNNWFTAEGLNIPEWKPYIREALAANGHKFPGAEQVAKNLLSPFHDTSDMVPIRPRYHIDAYNPLTKMASVNIYLANGQLSDRPVQISMEHVAGLYRERMEQPGSWQKTVRAVAGLVSAYHYNDFGPTITKDGKKLQLTPVPQTPDPNPGTDEFTTFGGF